MLFCRSILSLDILRSLHYNRGAGEKAGGTPERKTNMRVIDQMDPDENMIWCKPFVSEDGRIAVAVKSGRMCGLSLNGVTVEIPADRAEYRQLLDDAVKQTKGDAAKYEAWDRLATLLDGLRETGCSKCPAKDTCEEVNQPAD